MFYLILTNIYNKPLDMESIYKSDVVVVGSGISGLMVAISLYPRKVTLVTKKKLGEMSSSSWAQGGIAAAV